MGFEFRLGDDPQCDLLVCALESRNGAKWLGELATRHAGSGSEWEALASLANAWGGPDGSLQGKIDRVWLEFDMPSPDQQCVRSRSERDQFGETLNVPSVFFSTQPSGSSVGAPLRTEWLRETLTILADRGSLDGAVARTTELVEELNVRACIFQVGIMVGRASPLVRLCLLAATVDDAFSTLSLLPSAAARQQADALLREWQSDLRHIVLDLDLDSHGIRPAFGLEVYVNSPDSPLSSEDWSPIARSLRRKGLINEAKFAAMSTYPRAVSAHNVAGMPGEYRHLAALLMGHGAGAFVASIHHIKLSYRPDSSAFAKAYLALWHVWA
jgi:hypothetical protein